jgi:hypothetical protein
MCRVVQAFPFPIIAGFAFAPVKHPMGEPSFGAQHCPSFTSSPREGDIGAVSRNAAHVCFAAGVACSA